MYKLQLRIFVQISNYGFLYKLQITIFVQIMDFWFFDFQNQLNRLILIQNNNFYH